MTPEQYLIKQLSELWLSSDPEYAHGIADNLLLGFINDKEVSEAFEKVPRWYA